MITIEEIRRHCLRKKGDIDEDFPFDDETLVIKVYGKSFLFCSLTSHPSSINLKCEPVLALELRARYEAVRPGYHMNKKHWNTVVLDGSIPVSEIVEMIDHSYDQVVKGLPLRVRRKLEKSKPARGRDKKKDRTRRPRSRRVS